MVVCFGGFLGVKSGLSMGHDADKNGVCFLFKTSGVLCIYASLHVSV